MYLQPCRERLNALILELEQEGEYVAASHASMALDVLDACLAKRTGIVDPMGDQIVS